MPFEDVAKGAAAGGLLGGPPGALIGAGASILGDVVNSIAQGANNRKQREFAVEMYNRQRADALSDWSMQNAYNSPEQQMARLKAAGLNPNLVYGSGAVANNASGVRSSSPGSYNPHAPSWGNIPGTFIGTYYDAQIKQATVDNMAEQKKVLQSQAVKNIADAVLKGALKGRTEQVTSQSQSLFPTVLETAKAQLDQINADILKKKADTKFTLDANERAELLSSSSIAQGIERIALMRAQAAHMSADRNRILQTIQLMKQQGVLNDFEISLNKKGLSKNDDIKFRIGSRLIDMITDPSSPGPLPSAKPGINPDFKKWWHDAFNGLFDF